MRKSSKSTHARSWYSRSVGNSYRDIIIRLFDRVWYLHEYPELISAGVDPYDDYKTHGTIKARNPNPIFDADWYLTTYPDVIKTGLTPLEHYVRIGAYEGRDPNCLFDTDWYIKINPDVAEMKLNALDHYLAYGGAEGRAPHPLFNPGWYTRQAPEAAKNPLGHYLTEGQFKGLGPAPSLCFLLLPCRISRTRVPKYGTLLHYLTVGAKTGLNPNPLFNTRWYENTLPEVAESEFDPSLPTLCFLRRSSGKRPF